MHEFVNTVFFTHINSRVSTVRPNLVSEPVRAKASCVFMVTSELDRASSGLMEGAFGQLITLGSNRANWFWVSRIGWERFSAKIIKHGESLKVVSTQNQGSA